MSPSTVKLNLRQLKTQAKDLVRAIRAGDQSSIARVVPYFASQSAFTLANAHLVIARENGFESWPLLRKELDAAADAPTRPDRTAIYCSKRLRPNETRLRWKS